MYADVTRFVEELQLDGEDPTVFALQLEQRGLAELLRTFARTPQVHLTDAGGVAVRGLKELQKNRAARLRNTMDAFLRWPFATAGGQTPINPALFLGSPGSSFPGIEIGGTDLQQTLAHLAGHDLVEALDTHPATVAIAPQDAS